MSAEILIYPKDRPENIFRIWPSPEIIPAGTIYEDNDYYFILKGEEEATTAELYIDGEKLTALRPTYPKSALWRWNSGFYAGKIDFCLELPNKKNIFFELISDPVLEKLTRNEFSQMVGEILEDSMSLFSISCYKIGISKGSKNSSPAIARLEFLRSKLVEIEKVIHKINDAPVRVLRTKTEEIPIHRLKRVKAKEFLRSTRSQRCSLNTLSNNKLAFKYIPPKILTTKKTTGLDIREHRDIKKSLNDWRVWLLVIAKKLKERSSGDATIRQREMLWSQRSNLMAKRINKLLSLPLFNEVSDHNQPISMSSIYKRIPDYKLFYKLNRDFEAGVSNILGDFLELPLSRTFELYELWVYLRLLKAAIDIYGLDVNPSNLFEYNPRNGSLTITMNNKVVQINNEISLAFKKNFKEYWLSEDKTGSFTRKMEPDLSIMVDKDKDKDSFRKVIVLDAKYRIRSGLNEAISSIHTYRDALVKGCPDGTTSGIVVGAYLLSPHKSLCSDSWQNTEVPNRFFHPEYRGSFYFGAVTLYPGMSSFEISNSLLSILRDAEVHI